MNKTLVFFVALILLFAGFGAVVTAYRLSREQNNEATLVVKDVQTIPDHMKAPEGVPEDELITEFTLTERSGKKFNSKELDGQVHVASFFFASCPSTCRAQNEAVRVLHRDYGDKGVKFLSISVDPEKDTPERLREYAGLFAAHPDEWLFLTGDMLYTRRIGAEIYQMHVAKEVHSNRLVIVDKAGQVRGSFNWQEEPQVGKMRTLIDQLLEEQPPAKDDDAEADEPIDSAASDDAEANSQDAKPDAPTEAPQN